MACEKLAGKETGKTHQRDHQQGRTHCLGDRHAAEQSQCRDDDKAASYTEEPGKKASQYAHQDHQKCASGMKQKAPLGIALAGWTIIVRMVLEIDVRNASLPHRLPQHAQRYHPCQPRKTDHQGEGRQLVRNPVANWGS
jgi:hypothetical protein